MKYLLTLARTEMSQLKTTEFQTKTSYGKIILDRCFLPLRYQGVNLHCIFVYHAANPTNINKTTLLTYIKFRTIRIINQLVIYYEYHNINSLNSKQNNQSLASYKEVWQGKISFHKYCPFLILRKINDVCLDYDWLNLFESNLKVVCAPYKPLQFLKLNQS